MKAHCKVYSFFLAASLAFAQAPPLTPDYPGSLPADSVFSLGANFTESTLASNIDNSTLSIPLSNASGFTTSGIIRVDTEFIRYCSKTVNTLNVCSGSNGRGQDQANGGSAPAAHSSGALVRDVVMAYHHNRLVAEVRAIQAELGATGAANFYDLRTDEDIGLHFMDIQEIAVPANPAAATRRLFIDEATGEFSVRTSAGVTTSLENTTGVLRSTSFDWSQNPGGALISGANTITLTPCPLGVDGTGTKHFIKITDATSGNEGVLITGGTCTSGASSGTVQFTTSSAHTATEWTIGSASFGIQEAVNAAATKETVLMVSGTYPVTKVFVDKEIRLLGAGIFKTLLTAGVNIQSPMIEVDPVVAVTWFELGNFGVDVGTNTTTKIISLKDLSRPSLYNIFISAGDDALTMSDTVGGTFYNLDFRKPQRGIFIQGDGGLAHVFDRVDISAGTTGTPGAAVEVERTTGTDQGGVWFEKVFIGGDWTRGIYAHSSVANTPLFIFLEKCSLDALTAGPAMEFTNIRRVQSEGNRYLTTLASAASIIIDGGSRMRFINDTVLGVGAGGDSFDLRNSPDDLFFSFLDMGSPNVGFIVDPANPPTNVSIRDIRLPVGGIITNDTAVFYAALKTADHYQNPGRIVGDMIHSAETSFLGWGNPNNSVGFNVSTGMESKSSFDWKYYIDFDNSGTTACHRFLRDAGTEIMTICEDDVVTVAQELQWTEAAGDPACVAGEYWIAANDTSNLFRKCQDGVLSDLASGGTTHDILSATHPDTLAASVVRGDVVIGNTTPAWSRLAVGGVGTYLRSDATDPSWSTLDATDLTTGTVPVARVGADHLDAVSEIAAGIKRGPDATDTHLLTTDVAAPAGLRCLQMDTDGSVVLDTDTCSNLGPGGTTTIDALGDAAGTGTVAIADFAQIWDWDSPATSVAKDALTLNYTLDASTDATTQRILRVVRTEAANTGVLEAMLSIENLDTAAAVTAAIEIRSAAGGITSALDLNDAQITTLIEFTTGSISPSDLELLDDGTITLTTETTGNYADGDGEAGAALTGDSATSFFSSGNLELARLPIGTGNQLIKTNAGATAQEHATLAAEGGDEISVTFGVGTITLDVVEANLDLAASGGTLGTGQAATAFVIEGDIGTGLEVDGTQVNTLSQETGFLDDLGAGDLTCGGSNFGRVAVNDADPLQYCDGEATPVRRVAAYGADDGDALAGDTATAFFDAGEIEVARGGSGVGSITGLIQGNTTSDYTAITNSSTVGEVLRVTGAATYAWGALDLADGDAVTGVLDESNLDANVVLDNATNTYGAFAQSFAAASMTLPVSAGAAPTANGAIAYDSTASQLEYGDNTVNRVVVNLDEAQTLVAKTLTTPTISGTGFTNAQHAHLGATSGGQLTAPALPNSIRDRKASYNLPDPVTGDDGDYHAEFPAACTLQEVACNVQGGTSATIDLYERARATPESGTTGMLTTPLVCDTNGAVTTSFTDAALAADVPLALGITAASGSPTLLRVHVKCRTD